MTSLALLGRYLHRGDMAVAERVALGVRRGGGWATITYGGLERRSGAVAARLAAEGVAPGDRVVLLGEAGIDWTAALLGALRRGAVVVPLDVKLPAAELVALVRRSEPAAALVTPALASRWADVAAGEVPTVDAGHPGTAGAAEHDVARPASDPAVVVWTSGTTGEPKGVTLSFANLAYVADRSRVLQGAGPDDRWLSVLPPTHLLELCCGLLPALAAASTTFVAGTIVPAELASIMAERRIDTMVAVPMVLRLLQRHLASQARQAGVAGAWLRTAVGVAGRAPSAALRRQLLRRLHRPLGGRFRTFYCGGAPLDQDVAGFFEGLGIEVLEGYGLTEAAPAVTMNSRRHHRAGSVGRPLPRTEVRISPAGEILVRGPGVMLGYWHDDAATREALDADGWLHTGDLGHLDGDGYLFVTGRAKSMIVLDSGKKVQPEEVEAHLARGDRFADVCVVGLRHPGRAGEQVCAVVVPSQAMSSEAVDEEVRRLTAGLAGFKRPTMVRVLEGELPATSKRSPRRARVVQLLEEAEVRR